MILILIRYRTICVLCRKDLFIYPSITLSLPVFINIVIVHITGYIGCNPCYSFNEIGRVRIISVKYVIHMIVFGKKYPAFRTVPQEGITVGIVKICKEKFCGLYVYTYIIAGIEFVYTVILSYGYLFRRVIPVICIVGTFQSLIYQCDPSFGFIIIFVDITIRIHMPFYMPGSVIFITLAAQSVYPFFHLLVHIIAYSIKRAVIFPEQCTGITVIIDRIQFLYDGHIVITVLRGIDFTEDHRFVQAQIGTGIIYTFTFSLHPVVVMELIQVKPYCRPISKK